MATQVLPGGICDGLRELAEPDVVQVLTCVPPALVVTEFGDTRLLPISREVAEVLIAYGMSYGN